MEVLQALAGENHVDPTMPDTEDPKRKKTIERKQKKYDSRLKKRASRPKARTERVTLDAVAAQTYRSSRVAIESEEWRRAAVNTVKKRR